MRIVVHREIPDDPELQQQWNALVLEMECPEVFYTHEWALAAGRSAGVSLAPLLALAYEGEKLNGVAALATDPGGKTASFLYGTSADYCDLLSSPDQRTKLLGAVLTELRRAGLENIILTSLPADSATIPVLRSAAREHGYYLFVRPTAVCSQVQLRNQEERLQLKTAIEKKKMFRRNMSVLGKEGPVSFSHLTSWEEIEPALAGFNVAHVARFLAIGRLSNVVSEQRRIFLCELARLLSQSGWLVLSRMLLANRPIAWNYGFQFQGSWFWYQPTFDTAYERVSPGYCLLSEIVTEACNRPEMRVVDLGLGAEGYKERFANSTRRTLHVHLTKSFGRHMWEVVRYHAARAVKSFPVAESAVRAVFRYGARARQELVQGGTRSLAARIRKRAVRWLKDRTEIVFYRWEGNRSGQKFSCEELSLEPIDLETLAVAAISYADEADTLDYLLRAAGRLHAKSGQGFALLERKRAPVHFCWVGDFEGFEMEELKIHLPAAGQDAAMIFDCWTPRCRRRRGYYGIALSQAAQQISKSGKEPWIFSAVTNRVSMKGIEKAGFERKYSMIRKKTLLWHR